MTSTESVESEITFPLKDLSISLEKRESIPYVIAKQAGFSLDLRNQKGEMGKMSLKFVLWGAL